MSKNKEHIIVVLAGILFITAFVFSLSSLTGNTPNTITGMQVIEETGNITLTSIPKLGGNLEGTGTNLLISVPHDIKATPNPGYYFMNWTVIQGDCEIKEEYNPFTQVTLLKTTDCKINAYFSNTPLANLTLTHEPPLGGSVKGDKINTPIYDQPQIDATPHLGYYFSSWEVKQGNCQVKEPNKPSTYVTFLSSTDCQVIAYFSPDILVQQANLTVITSPPNTGVTTGTSTNFPINVWKPINVTPNTGYYFWKWTSSTIFQITGIYETNETVYVNQVGTHTMTANLVPNTSTNGYLILIPSPETFGTVIGSLQNVTVLPNTTTITATPSPGGYTFKNWTIVQGNCSVTSTGSSTTTATIGSGATCKVIAYFNPPTASLIVGVYPSATHGVTNGTELNFVVPTDKNIDATPFTDFKFVNWYKFPPAGSNNCTINNTLLANTKVHILTSTICRVFANFTYNGTGTANLTVDTISSSYGTVTGTANNINVPNITNITTTPTAGYNFSKWIKYNDGDCALSSTSIPNTTVKIWSPTNCNVIGTFYKPGTQGNLLFVASPSNGGNATNTSGNTTNVNVPFTVKVQATANYGYNFSYWILVGNCMFEYPYSINDLAQNVTIYSDTCTVNAYFTQLPYANVTLTAGTGGTVNGTASNLFPIPYLHPISATPTPGQYTFKNWTITGGVCTVTSQQQQTTLNITAATHCYATAYFNQTVQPTANIIITQNPLGAGTISGGGSSLPIPSNQTLTAAPNPYHTFKNWTKTFGVCQVQSPYTLTTNVSLTTSENCQITVYFEPKTANISVGSGSVTAAGNVTVFGGQTTNFPIPVNKTIIATPNTGYEFLNWTQIGGVCTVQNPQSATTNVSITTSTNCVVIAYFNQTIIPPEPTANLYLSLNPTNGGTVSGSGSFSLGLHNISANAFTGYSFTNWTKTSGTCTITNASSSSTTVNLTQAEDCFITAYFNQTIIPPGPTANLYVYSYISSSMGNTSGTTPNIPIPFTQNITAVPNKDFAFVNWFKHPYYTYANCTLNNSYLSNTTVHLFGSGDCFLFANFSYIGTEKGNLIAFTPYPEYGTLTGTEYNLSIPAIRNMVATPIENYHSIYFGGHTGSCEVIKQYNVSGTEIYTVYVYAPSNCLIPIYFTDNGNSNVSIMISPNNSGIITTSPQIIQNINTPENLILNATPISGYTFSNWTINSGNCAFQTYGTPYTSIHKIAGMHILSSGDCNLTAYFAPTQYANLTVSSWPPGPVTNVTGSENNISVPAVRNITAIASESHPFRYWVVNSGNCTIENNKSETTKVYINTSTDCNITGHFGVIACCGPDPPSPSPPGPNRPTVTGNLTLTLDPPGSGTTIGTEANIVLPATKNITAIPSAGYTFAQWTITSGNCTINNAYSAATNVTFLSRTNCVIMAHFSLIPVEINGTDPVVIERGDEPIVTNEETPGTVITPEPTGETKAFFKRSGVKLLLGIIILAVLIAGAFVGMKKIKKKKPTTPTQTTTSNIESQINALKDQVQKPATTTTQPSARAPTQIAKPIAAATQTKATNTALQENQRKYAEYVDKLNKYVDEMRRRGFKDEDIKAKLVKANTNPKVLESAMKKR